jgi:hypothetical protein
MRLTFGPFKDRPLEEVPLIYKMFLVTNEHKIIDPQLKAVLEKMKDRISKMSNYYNPFYLNKKFKEFEECTQWPVSSQDAQAQISDLSQKDSILSSLMKSTQAPVTLTKQTLEEGRSTSQ